ncbi:uncharacterized protein TrAtP1_003229 [Trichoderma atroviride]|uniref:uncharacterized protein n=1 Tax=Hypocrea atroviridis TaxID=63577 RepID=UPI00331D2C87|nr:hypothetical protein TrAtP1_003229 [Trichoderma atroviride]
MVKRATLLGETLAHLEECQLESGCAALSVMADPRHAGCSTETRVLGQLSPNIHDASSTFRPEPNTNNKTGNAIMDQWTFGLLR